MEFKILSEIFDNLPVMEIKGKMFAPVFNYGSHADLIKFLRLKRKQTGANKQVYPLVWLETPVTFTRQGGTKSASINLVLATLSTANLSNRERTSVTFDNTLDPLLNNVIKALYYDSRTRVDQDTAETTKYFNYETDEETGATDIWDAIGLRIDIKINVNC